MTKELKPDFWMYGEIVGGDYNRWANPEALDSVTNYEIYKGLYSSHNDRNYFEFAHSMDRECGEDNHDVTRLASILRDKALQKNVYTMLYTMPGAPSIYYGSEFGVEGRIIKNQSDDDVRREMNLNALENPDYDLFEHICKLGKIKHTLEALQTGQYKNETIQLEHLCYSMHTDHQKVYVLLNQSNEPRRIGINTSFNGVLTDVLNDNNQYPCNGYTEIIVEPKSSMILIENDGSYRIDFDDTESVEPIVKEIKEASPAPAEKILEPEEIVLGKYRHFKGNEYEVVGFAKDSETTEKMVIYRALYGEKELWVRPYEMFREIIERDGKRMRRFEKIDG